MARPRKKAVKKQVEQKPTPSRMEEIVLEAVKTCSISNITTAERFEIAERYAQITGQSLNAWCNACVMEACFTIYNNKGITTQKR